MLNYSQLILRGRFLHSIFFSAFFVFKAHCLYKHEHKAWKKATTFSPARFRGRIGRTRNPYGRWQVEYMQTYHTFVISDNIPWSYDMAVLKLKPRFGKYIGQRIGYAGITLTAPTSEWLNEDLIRGYPYDKPDAQMWQSGPCSFGDYREYRGEPGGDEYLSKNDCDVARAMSGSAVMSTNGYIHGIFVAMACISSDNCDQSHFNVVKVMNGRNYYNALKWSGRA